jgi:uncharacterized membrane protein YbhN (UPF0104 family)
LTEHFSEDHEPQGPPLWRRLVGKHPLRRGILLILVGLVAEYLVLPQIAEVSRSLHLLSRVNIGFVVLAVLLEVASLASYAKLTQAVLPSGASSLSRIWRIDLSTLAVGHVLPGGTAGGGGLGYRLLTNDKVSGSDAGIALAIQGILSALVLNAILWVALIVSIPLTGFNPIYATVAIIGALLLAAFAALVLLVTKGEERAAIALRNLAARLPFLKQTAPDTADRLVHQIAARIRVMAADRALLRRAVLWAAANWLMDAASLFVFLVAFGKVVNPDGLPRRLRPCLRVGGHTGNPGGARSRRRSARAEPRRLRCHAVGCHRRSDRLSARQLLAADPRRCPGSSPRVVARTR